MKKGLLFCFIISLLMDMFYTTSTKNEGTKESLSNSQPCLSKEILKETSHITCDKNKELYSISGVIFHNNLFWAISDDNKNGKLYVISPESGKLVGEILIETTAAEKWDWEDIAQDDTYVYIASTGANSTRKVKSILRIKKTDIQKNSITPDVLHFYYTDSTGEKTDCEALIIKNKLIHLFIKSVTNPLHYTIPLTSFGSGEFVKANEVGQINSLCKIQITGADVKKDTLVLIGYDRLYGNDSCKKARCAMFIFNLNNKDNNIELLSRYYLGNEKEVGQIESVFFKGDTIIIINELGDMKNCQKDQAFLKYL